MIALIYAHPYPGRSRANRVLLEGVRGLPNLDVRSLYDLYPDFAIDVEAEQRALHAAKIVVWQHPMYWYSVPPLLKLWFDKVLAHGWAYGEGGRALRDKVCQWVVTAGGDTETFSERGMHGRSIEGFTPPIEQTAKFCGMCWQPPIVVQGAHRVTELALHEAARVFRERLSKLIAVANEEDGDG